MNQSPQVLIALGVEALLILVTFVFLNAPRTRAALQWAGMIMLCLTFCWSVIFGCVIALTGSTLRI
jgi:hypothetical protein